MTDREHLQAAIAKQALIQPYRNNQNDELETPGWVFDFRLILLQPEYLKLATQLLFELVPKKERIQFCGLESAAIPLVTTLTLKADETGVPANGLYVRKSRKKHGLYRTIEGASFEGDVVLVDDIINSSQSMIKQVEVLETKGYKVTDIICIICYRTDEEYEYLNEKGIKIHSLFKLTDFNLAMLPRKRVDRRPFKIAWHFKTATHSPFLSIARSTPALTEDFLITASDDGFIRALKKRTGEVAWEFEVGSRHIGKRILSSPIVHDGNVYIGSYDGNVYALSIKDGTLKWRFNECEWIGSTASIDPDNNTLYIGLEHGRPFLKGGIVALDSETGVEKWHYDLPALTHATPLFIKKHNAVAIGGNDGRCYLFDATTGKLRWQYETTQGLHYPGYGGFGPSDIKSAPAYDAETDTISYATFEGSVYVLSVKNGSLVHKLETERDRIKGAKIGIYVTPTIYKDKIIVAGLDKIVYCFDKHNGELLWRVPTRGRLFSQPVVHNDIIYAGSNDGCVYEIDLSGNKLAERQFPERIVAPVVFDDKERMRFFTTNACEVFANKY